MYMKLKELKEIIKQKSSEIRELKKEIKKTQKADGIAGGMQFKLSVEKGWIRHRHIAYSLLRGRKYEEIEQHCREDHKPFWSIIKEIKNEYAENVRACA